jgi:hypothetical protein
MSKHGVERRIKIPSVLLKEFEKELRILFPVDPAGLCPVPYKLVSNPDLMKQLISEKGFQENFEIVIVPRTPPQL